MLRVSPGSHSLRGLVEGLAVQFGVPARELFVRSLLELPGIATSEGLAKANDAASLVEAVAVGMPSAPTWRPFDRLPPIELRGMRFEEVDELTAKLICEQWHYIRSHRVRSMYFGIFRPDVTELPVTLFVVSDFDQHNAFKAEDFDRPKLLSRVFSFHDAPKNAISYGLAHLGRLLGEATPTLATAVNPNVGFTGASYRASGWQQIGEEPFSHYAYSCGRFITERQEESLMNEKSHLLTRSKMPLLPKAMYGRVYRSAGELRGVERATDSP